MTFGAVNFQHLSRKRLVTPGAWSLQHQITTFFVLFLNNTNSMLIRFALLLTKTPKGTMLSLERSASRYDHKITYLSWSRYSSRKNNSFSEFIEKNNDHPFSDGMHWFTKSPRRVRTQWCHKLSCLTLQQYLSMKISSSRKASRFFSGSTETRMIAQAPYTTTGIQQAAVRQFDQVWHAPARRNSCSTDIEQAAEDLGYTRTTPSCNSDVRRLVSVLQNKIGISRTMSETIAVETPCDGFPPVHWLSFWSRLAFPCNRSIRRWHTRVEGCMTRGLSGRLTTAIPRFLCQHRVRFSTGGKFLERGLGNFLYFLHVLNVLRLFQFFLRKLPINSCLARMLSSGRTLQCTSLPPSVTTFVESVTLPVPRSPVFSRTRPSNWKWPLLLTDDRL